MDWTIFPLQCLLLLSATLEIVSAQNDQTCEIDPEHISSGDAFMEVHTFKAEEGILLEPRKLIGIVTLNGNVSSAYSFDEPMFKKPRNLKVDAKPAHFEIAFVDIDLGRTSTTGRPTTRPGTESTRETFPAKEILKTTHAINDNEEGSGKGHNDFTPTSAPSTYNGSSTFFLNSTVPSSRTTNLVTAASSAELPTSDCVKAYIYQIYDLDREEQDTHFLTITGGDTDLWSVPTVIKIEVTDINDNTPVFVKSSLNSTILNYTSTGMIIAEVQATDADIGINADLRYQILYNTERRGNETHSPDFPSVFIHQTSGNVVMATPIDDLKPPSQFTFAVVVKDRADQYVCNRATATVTIYIIDKIASQIIEHSSSSDDRGNSALGGIIAGSVLGAVVFLSLIVLAVCKCNRRRIRQGSGTLQFMMDDETLISA